MQNNIEALKLLIDLFIKTNFDYTNFYNTINNKKALTQQLDDNTLINIRNTSNGLIVKIITRDFATIQAFIKNKENTKAWIPGVADRKLVTSTIDFKYNTFNNSNYNTIKGRIILDDEKISYYNYEESQNITISHNSDVYGHLEFYKDKINIARLNLNDTSTLLAFFAENKSAQIDYDKDGIEILTTDNEKKNHISTYTKEGFIQGTNIKNIIKFNKVIDSEGLNKLSEVISLYYPNYYQEIANIRKFCNEELFDKLASMAFSNLDDKTYKIIFGLDKKDYLAYKLTKF